MGPVSAGALITFQPSSVEPTSVSRLRVVSQLEAAVKVISVIPQMNMDA